MLLEAVVHRFCGSNNNLQTLDYKSARFLSCVITQVPSILPKIIFNTQGPNIEIRHHFIRDHVNNGNCEVKFVETKLQLSNIFTKPLPKERFFFLRNELGILDLNNLS